jgi:hypothetical protein
MTILFFHLCLGLPNCHFLSVLGPWLCTYTSSVPYAIYCQSGGRAVAGFQQRMSKFEPSSCHVVLVVDKVALGHVFSEYLGFPYQFSFHWLFHIHHLSSRAGTIGQIVADIQSELILIPPQETKEKKLFRQSPTCVNFPRYLLLFRTRYYIQHPLLHQS